MKKIVFPLYLLWAIIIVVSSCIQKNDGPHSVAASAVITLDPEITHFSSAVGDSLEITVGVEGERAFQSLVVNKILNGATIKTFSLVEDTGIDIFPPYSELFRYTLEDDDSKQPFELEFRLESMEVTPSGGRGFSYSSMRISITANE